MRTDSNLASWSPAQRVGIVGATGLIGGGFADSLADSNFVSLGRAQSCDRSLDLAQTIANDIFDGIGCLVHAAGVTDEEVRVDPVEASVRAHHGSRQLFVAAARAGVKEIIYVSSAHVYGPLVGGVDENRRVQPLSDYAIAHFCAESVLCDVVKQFGLRAVVVRPNAVFGQTFDVA